MSDERIRQRQFTAANNRAKSLRENMTYTEKAVWAVLRKMEGLPGRFRRQAPVGPYVVDFLCHAMKLVVEIDGGVHRLPDVVERDARRDAWLASEGFTVVRIPNDEALDADALTNRVRSAAPHP